MARVNFPVVMGRQGALGHKGLLLNFIVVFYAGLRTTCILFTCSPKNPQQTTNEIMCFVNPHFTLRLVRTRRKQGVALKLSRPLPGLHPFLSSRRKELTDPRLAYLYPSWPHEISLLSGFNTVSETFVFLSPVQVLHSVVFFPPCMIPPFTPFSPALLVFMF